jgi:hypothetical protein
MSYSPGGNVSPHLAHAAPFHQIQLQRNHPQIRPPQSNLFFAKNSIVHKPPHSSFNNPIQVISQFQTTNGVKTKQRSFSRAYETPKANQTFMQYPSSRKNAKAVSTGVNNGRRINQTIEIGSTIDDIDIDAVISPSAPTNKTIQTTQNVSRFLNLNLQSTRHNTITLGTP